MSRFAGDEFTAAAVVFAGEDPPRGGPGGEASRVSRDLQRLRALIVEDELLVAWHLESLLEDLGHEVCSIAPSAEAALRDFRTLEPDIVFMDVNLGAGPDGVETARRLRRETPVPIIFVTAYGSSQTRAAIHDAAPGSVIVSKPVSASDLHAAVEAALKTRH
jgi:DNA-binding response OmpR family regulator